MTPDQLAALHTEVLTDPKGLGYTAHLPDSPGLVVDLLMTSKVDTVLGPLRTTTAKAWAARGPYSKIFDAAMTKRDDGTWHPCRASCLVIRDSFACGDPIHVEEPDIQQLLAAWVLTGIATQAEVDDLYALARVPATRAEALGLGVITVKDILDAGVVQ